ncbi:MAG: glycosyltransferase family 2 protein [Candidatus Omnitrophica bacterium]|nr:glycosyltransferase family 2 protein [Candidatus Omnitrophota bacterium]
MHTSPRPSVCVSIVHYLNPDLLELCLKSFMDHPPNLDYRIVVADNSANLLSLCDRIGKQPKVELREMESNLGFSAANNRAVEGATEDYLFFLNPDAEIRNGTLETLVAYLEGHPDVGAVGPTNLGPNGEIQYSCRSFPGYWTVLANRYSFLTRLFPNNPMSNRYLKTEIDRTVTQEVDWVSGAALMMRRRDFEELGGFDEDFFLYAEDVDLCYRIHRLGKKVVYHPESAIQHTIGGSSRKNRFRSLWERHRSMYTFYRKHYSADIPLMDLITLFGILSRALVFLTLELMGGAPHRSAGSN